MWYPKYRQINHNLTAFWGIKLVFSQAFTLIKANIKLLEIPL